MARYILRVSSAEAAEEIKINNGDCNNYLKTGVIVDAADEEAARVHANQKFKFMFGVNISPGTLRPESDLNGKYENIWIDKALSSCEEEDGDDLGG